MLRTFFAILLLMTNSFIFGQKDYKNIKTDWQAMWIGEDLPSLPNTWTRFRKNIKLEQQPNKYFLNISTDSKYWLWINNELVIFEGQLKRGPTPSDTYFDKIDIAKHLKTGENQISILVWYWGQEGFCHKSSGKLGLLVESDQEPKLLTDSSWKMAQYVAFKNSYGPHPNFRLPEHNVHFDARLAENNWFESSFEDKNWQNATVLGKANEQPWGKLWQRPFISWYDSGLIDYSSKDYTQNKNGQIVLKLPRNTTITPYFKIKADKAGLLIDIRTDNYKGGSENNIRTEYITKIGVQEFETPAVMNGHEVIYTFPKGISVEDLKYRETRFNSKFEGEFISNNAFYNSLWQKSLVTMDVNMRDAIQDPDRERAQWWGDAVIILEEIFYGLDVKSHAAIRKSISNLLEWQKPDGVLFSPIPAGNWDKELPAQMLASVGKFGIWQYYIHSGDKDFIAYAYPFVKKYMDLWQIGKDNLVVHRKGGWDWHDWGDKQDVPILDNAWYILALEGQRNMASLLGKTEEAAQIQTKMDALKIAFQEFFWNGQYFKSKDFKYSIDDRAQGMAIVAGLANKEQWKTIKPILDTTFIAGPYLEKYILEAYFLMDDTQGGLNRMQKRYQKMVDSPITTLWEGWDIGSATYGGGTYNHGWSGGPLSLLSRYVAGIKPIGAGYNSFEVKPCFGNLNEIKSKISTVNGNIAYELMLNGNLIFGKINNQNTGNGHWVLPLKKNQKFFYWNGFKIEKGKKINKKLKEIMKVNWLLESVLIETKGKFNSIIKST